MRTAVLLLLVAAPLAADDFPRRWRMLYPSQGPTPLAPADGLKITGPHVEHPFYLGEHLASGVWNVEDGRLVSDGSPAVTLGTGEDFELEAVVDATGTGGLFLLVGHDAEAGRGFGVWNATMRTSGSPWGAFGYDRGAAVDGTAEELDPFEWKGEQPLKLSVVGGRVTLVVGPHAVLTDREMPEYSGGDVVLGAYGTRYGPRKLKIRAVRARALPGKKAK